MAAPRVLLFVGLLAVAAGVSEGGITLGSFRKTIRVSKAVVAARARAFQQSLSTALYAIVADTSGAIGEKYAEDADATGSCTFALETATNVSVRITITNMAGTPPPFKSYIRIGEGPYIDRVVIGVPDEIAPGTGWTETPGVDGDGNTVVTWSLITYWDETTLFPRIPGWTLNQIFAFLDADANSFFCTIHTAAFRRGANRGNFTVYTPPTV
jgi:hypothetical protein